MTQHALREKERKYHFDAGIFAENGQIAFMVGKEGVHHSDTQKVSL